MLFLLAAITSLLSCCLCFENNYTIGKHRLSLVNPQQPGHQIPLDVYYPVNMDPDAPPETYPLLIFGHCLEGMFCF